MVARVGAKVFEMKKAPEWTGGLLSINLNDSIVNSLFTVHAPIAILAGGVGLTAPIAIFADAMLEARKTNPRATIIIFDNFFMAVSRLRL